MKKKFLLYGIACCVVAVISCNNNEPSAARAGTSDSDGTGHAKGKGTPYRGDSAVKNIQSDTASYH